MISSKIWNIAFTLDISTAFKCHPFFWSPADISK